VEEIILMDLPFHRRLKEDYSNLQLEVVLMNDNVQMLCNMKLLLVCSSGGNS